jgi:hypothetical protein
MPEVVAAASGPQGKANLYSWDVLEQQPSPEEAFGELGESTAKEPAPESEPEERKALSVQSQPEAEKQQPEPEEAESKSKLSRYDRTKQKRKALEEREARLAQREWEFAQNERARLEEQRKAAQPPYTIAELRKYRKVWDNPNHKDYSPDLVEKVDAEIERLEELEAQSKDSYDLPKAGTAQFVDLWHQAEKELYDYDPEFQRDGTRLDNVLRAMLEGPEGDLYRQHPRGIVAAYHKARLDIAYADLEYAYAENQKLQNELTRLNGLTSVGGSGGAGRSVGELRSRDFASLSTKEMREHLKRNASRNGHW